MKRLSAWPGHLPSEDALSACFDGISGSVVGHCLFNQFLIQEFLFEEGSGRPWGKAREIFALIQVFHSTCTCIQRRVDLLVNPVTNCFQKAASMSILLMIFESSILDLVEVHSLNSSRS